MTTLELRKAGRTAAVVGALVAVLGMSQGSAQEATNGQYCSSTANALLRACGFEVQDDYWKAVAKCTNVSEGAERTDCFAEAKTARNEANQLCRDQHAGRVAACGVLGEGRYDPEFDAEAFDPNFARLAHPNPYFPLTIGYRWEGTPCGGHRRLVRPGGSRPDAWPRCSAPSTASSRKTIRCSSPEWSNGSITLQELACFSI
jgi:hypothetical protein